MAVEQAVRQNSWVHESIEPRLEAARKQLEELEASTSERWSIIKTGVELALLELEGAYHEAVEAGPPTLRSDDLPPASHESARSGG